MATTAVISTPYALAPEIEQSRVMGEYYRDLSLNYQRYEESNDWPLKPSQPDRPVLIDYYGDGE